MLILDGEMYISYDFGENFHTVTKGYLVYSPKSMPRKAFTNADNPILCYAVNFQYALCKNGGENWILEENAPCLPIDRIIPIRNMEALISLFKELNREWQSKKKGYLLKCRIILMEIIQRVLRESIFTFYCPVDIQKIMQTGDRKLIEEGAREMMKLLGTTKGGFIAKDYPQWDAINVEEEWAQWARDIFINEGNLR